MELLGRKRLQGNRDQKYMMEKWLQHYARAKWKLKKKRAWFSKVTGPTSMAENTVLMPPTAKQAELPVRTDRTEGGPYLGWTRGLQQGAWTWSEEDARLRGLSTFQPQYATNWLTAACHSLNIILSNLLSLLILIILWWSISQFYRLKK